MTFEVVLCECHEKEAKYCGECFDEAQKFTDLEWRIKIQRRIDELNKENVGYSRMHNDIRIKELERLLTEKKRGE